MLPLVRSDIFKQNLPMIASLPLVRSYIFKQNLPLIASLPLVRSDISKQNLPMIASVTFILTFVIFGLLDSYQLVHVIARGELPYCNRNI